jgi:hypothetical protein
MQVFLGLLTIAVAVPAYGYGFYWGIKFTRPLKQFGLGKSPPSPPLKAFHGVTVWWIPIFVALIVGMVFLVPLQLVAVVIQLLR